MYVKPIGPIGASPILDQDRMPVIRVINGDSWKVDADLYNPLDFRPATAENTTVEFLLVENRFACEPYWKGTWFDGVYPDDVVPGLVHVLIPREVSGELRRGSYQFSIKVTDALGEDSSDSTDLSDSTDSSDAKRVAKTEVVGYFLVEYEPTSDTHNIPYRRDECQHRDKESR